MKLYCQLGNLRGWPETCGEPAVASAWSDRDGCDWDVCEKHAAQTDERDLTRFPCVECDGTGFTTEFDGVEEHETHRCWACSETAQKRADSDDDRDDRREAALAWSES